jgi:hypothetical protein
VGFDRRAINANIPAKLKAGSEIVRQMNEDKNCDQCQEAREPIILPEINGVLEIRNIDQEMPPPAASLLRRALA